MSETDIEIFKKKLEDQFPNLRKKIVQEFSVLEEKDIVYKTFKTDFPILWYYINENIECRKVFQDRLNDTVFYFSDSEGQLYGLKLDLSLFNGSE